MANTRKTRRSPVKANTEKTAVKASGNVEIIFTVPASELTVAPGGDYFNLPYLVKGEMRHGKKTIEAVISKGRVIIATAQGRAKRGNAEKPAAANAVNLSKLL